MSAAPTSRTRAAASSETTSSRASRPRAPPATVRESSRTASRHARASRLQGGDEADDERARAGDRHHEGDGAQVEVVHHPEGRRHRRAGDQLVDAPRRGQEPQPGARGRQQQRLDHELPQQAAAAGAERQPHGDLAALGDRLGEQQVRDVGAGDELDEDAGRQQQHQAHDDAGRRQPLEQRAHPHPAAVVGVRVLPRQGRGDRGELALGARDLDSVGEARHDLEAVIVTGAVGPQAERRPDLGVLGEREDGGHHADDGVRRAVEHQRAARHRGIGVEPLLPEPVADERDARALGAVLLFRETSPADRLDLERRERGSS